MFWAAQGGQFHVPNDQTLSSVNLTVSQVYSIPRSHFSLYAFPNRNHKKRRSSEYKTATVRSTTIDNVSNYFTDNTTTDNYNISFAATTFSPYVPGLYGSECVVRAMAYMNAHKTTVTFTVVDIGCACIGNCPSYLAPNPAAASYYQWFLAIQYTAQLVQRLQDNALYVAIICFIVIVGLAGKSVDYQIGLFRLLVWRASVIT